MHVPWQVDCLYLAALVNGALAVLVLARIRVPAAGPLALGILIAALWAADYGADLATADVAAKLWLLRVRFLFLPFDGLVWFEMAHRFALGRKYLFGRRLALAAVVPLMTVLLVWLPLPAGFEPMLRSGFAVQAVDGLFLLHFHLGPWSAVIFAYLVGFIGAGGWILWRTRRDTPWDRGAHRIIIAAGVLGLAANALFVLRVLPPPGFNYAPLLSPVCLGLVTFALLRGRFFTLAPVARATLIENLEERLVVLDSADRVVDLNHAAAAALGVAPEKVTGRPAAEVLAAWPEVVAGLRPAGAKSEVRIGEAIFELSLLGVRDRRGRPRARILSLRDVTRRRRDEEALRRAKEAAEAAGAARSRFLAMMSHEIRTPLNQILGFAQLLDGTGLQPDQRDCLQHIVRGGESLLGLVEEMLEYIQVTSGGLVLAAHPCAPRELTARVCEGLLPRAQAKGIALRWAVADRVPAVVRGDAARISQIVARLADNAVKFTDQGAVDVEVDAPGSLDTDSANGHCELAIVVRDTGVGIPPAVAGRLFEPLAPGDDSMTRRHGGVGLGLPIARRLCELMGGSLAVESTPGRGSVFTARIAVGREPADPAEGGG